MKINRPTISLVNVTAAVLLIEAAMVLLYGLMLIRFPLYLYDSGTKDTIWVRVLEAAPWLGAGLILTATGSALLPSMFRKVHFRAVSFLLLLAGLTNFGAAIHEWAELSKSGWGELEVTYLYFEILGLLAVTLSCFLLAGRHLSRRYALTV